MNKIKQLYEDHKHRAFPYKLNGEKAAGKDLIMLDADIAGCVSTFINNNGHLDEWRIGILKELTPIIDEVVKEIPLESREYFLSIQKLGQLVLIELDV